MCILNVAKDATKIPCDVELLRGGFLLVMLGNQEERTTFPSTTNYNHFQDFFLNKKRLPQFLPTVVQEDASDLMYD